MEGLGKCADHSSSHMLRVTVNAYQKLYSDYPVSVTFPQLSMANIVDTFGQAEWRPMCQIYSNVVCGTLQQNQMPMFPDAGLRWSY
jgi:hypothetical protein